MHNLKFGAMLNYPTPYLRVSIILIKIQFFTYSLGYEERQARYEQQDVGIYDVNRFGTDNKPQLRAIHESNHTNLFCSVAKPQPNADLYISCPALGSTPSTGICYQNCQPTRPCIKSDGIDVSCVPNEQAVFCHKSIFSNGTISLKLSIDRKDPRLVGPWSCSHAGLESTKFEVTLEQKKKIPDPQLPKIKAPSDSDSVVGPTQTDSNSFLQTEFNSNLLDYLNRREYVLGVIVVLVLSILLNLACCIRYQLLRAYIDPTQNRPSNAECLANWLCISRDTHKLLYTHRDPIYPRVGSWVGMNGSYETSSQLYPKQQTQLLLPQLSNNDLNGMTYIPVTPLSGSTRRNYAMRLQNMDQLNNANMIYQTENGPPLQQQQQHGYITDPQTGLTYIQASNASSPSMSQHLQHPNLNNTAVLEQTGAQQMAMRVQPAMFNGHVIYDEVAAGASSIYGQYNRNSVENPVLVSPQSMIYQQFNPQTSPVMDGRGFVVPNHDNYEPYQNGNMVSHSSTVPSESNQQIQPGLPPIGVANAGRLSTPTYARTMRSFSKGSPAITEEPSSNVDLTTAAAVNG